VRLSVPHYLRLQVEDAETATDCAAYRRQLTIDSKSRRTEMLGDLTANYNGIPRSYYRFGASWPHVRETLLVIQEQDGDPFAVMMPTTEIIRFYYAPSTRLAQALFWGEYGETFNAERSGVLEEGVVRVHLRQWMEDQDAWTLARYMCSPVMQCETIIAGFIAVSSSINSIRPM